MTEEIFTDTTPQKPGDKVIQITEKKIPYQIIVSVVNGSLCICLNYDYAHTV